jgi:formylmethanofuran dehydrogenase subunit D
LPETFILIPGRTSRQGCGISEGKFKPDYQEETHILQVSAQDVQRPGFAPGDRVRLRSETGEIEVAGTPSRSDEMPRASGSSLMATFPTA